MQRATFLGGLVLAASVAAAPVAAQVTLFQGTFYGGSSFSTTMTGRLTYLNGILTLDITNVGSGDGEVFAAIGIVNAPVGTVVPGTAPTGWTWETTNQFSGEALPDQSWAWVAASPKPQNGLQQGESATFSYNIGSLPYANIGFGVHAISGPSGCSTKFAVWNGGDDQTVTNWDEARRCIDVPEPESAVLLLTGLLAMGYVMSRRRRDEVA